jgi:hypothetical protein
VICGRGCENVSGEGCGAYTPGVSSTQLAPFGWIPSTQLAYTHQLHLVWPTQGSVRVLGEAQETVGTEACKAADRACMAGVGCA